jgi:hypothetical protein
MRAAKTMQNGKYIAARLCPKYGGDVLSRTPVICGINPQKYETICIYHTKNSDNPIPIGTTQP